MVFRYICHCEPFALSGELRHVSKHAVEAGDEAISLVNEETASFLAVTSIMLNFLHTSASQGEDVQKYTA